MKEKLERMIEKVNSSIGRDIYNVATTSYTTGFNRYELLYSAKEGNEYDIICSVAGHNASYDSFISVVFEGLLEGYHDKTRDSKSA